MSAAFRIFLCYSSPQHHHQHRLTTLFMVTKPHHTCMTKHAHTHKILSPSVAGYWNDVASARLRLDAADFWIAARLTTDLRNTNAMESAWHSHFCVPGLATQLCAFYRHAGGVSALALVQISNITTTTTIAVRVPILRHVLAQTAKLYDSSLAWICV